ncbi:MAG: tetratricopeptide repeat protein [Treponema sp.]|jgi:tetratricopeptide (TPR) repeat protein|nr:tetratricopeptide repeat protein [Treponema sp.]
MPSLKQLGEFQKSFLKMGREPETLIGLGRAPEDYPLPENDPAGPDPFEAETAAAGDDAFDETFADMGGGPAFSGDFDADGSFDSGNFTSDDPGPEAGDSAGGEFPADEDFSPIGEDGALDFSAFLDTLPDDLDAPASGESAAGEQSEGLSGRDGADDLSGLSDFEGTGEDTPETTDTGLDDTGYDAGMEVPADLLAGFADDIEQVRGEAVPDDTDMGFDSGDFDESGADAIDMGGDADGLDVSLGGTEEPDGFSLDDFEEIGDGQTGPEDSGIGLDDETAFGAGLDIPDDAFGEGAGQPGGDGDSGFEAPDDFDISGIDLGDGIDFSADAGDGADAEIGGGTGAGAEEAVNKFPDTGPPASGFTPVEDDDLKLNLPEETEGESFLTPSWNPDGEPLQESPAADSFDAFDIEGDAGLGTDLNLDTSKSDSGSGVFGGLEDFNLAGLDDSVFGSAVKMAPQSAPAAAKGKQRRAVKSAALKSEEVEEINLSEEQYNKILATINSYPLNLKLAVEEIIAEQVVEPALLSTLIKLLIAGGTPQDAASLAGKILGRTIPVPKAFEKKTGKDFEEEQAGFPYIFIHKFLPVAAIFLVVLLFAASLAFLIRQFIYLPLHAESIYKTGLERIEDGEYERAKDRFDEAFKIHRVKKWFYRYAEAFRDERQYLDAEEKYDQLLNWYPRDKKGALDYAAMETNLRNYPKAENIIRSNILNYAVNDRDGLLALGDNYLAWGEEDPDRYEDARSAYAKLLERYGWKDPIVERMLLYFIRTDNLAEVIPLQAYFDESFKRKIDPRTIAEMGGYLLDKRLEETDGVPDANISRIQGLRNLLLRAVRTGPALPEAHYHLARYYHDFGNSEEERTALERALSVFDSAPEESSRRIGRRIDAERRMAAVLTNSREFFKAEEHLVKGIGIFEDAQRRQRLSAAPEYGRLYADMGDLEYFTKSGDMETSLGFYRRAEQNDWAPPEIQYRMGAAHYLLGEWEDALGYFFDVSEEMPMNRRLLHALGNVSYKRGNFYAAQGYYSRLMDLLETERARFPALTPNDRPDHLELAERLMVARNNMGVTMEALTQRTGNPGYRAGALGLYVESSRAWDVLTRDPVTMVRSGAGELSTPGINLAFLNSRNLLYPRTGYEPELYLRIDKDVLEPSAWEELAPQGYRISGLE